MLWYSGKTDKAVSIMQEIKQKAVDIAKAQLNLATYQIREIRPEDLPSPSVNDFAIGIAAGQATRNVTRKVSSNSIIIIAGIYAPDVKNNMNYTTGTALEQPWTITAGFGIPTLKHIWFFRGTELIRKWPLCPVYADEDAKCVTEGYIIYYPDDVINIFWYAKEQMTVDQISQDWYLGIALLPPGATSATIAQT
jgi:hypothetical protein